MSAADPRVVWDALAARGYGPHGPVENFRSRCPAHDGDNRTSLSVKLDAGTILLRCHAHDCPVDEIRERLGLRWGDLFPSDRRYDARLRNARREDFTGHRRTAANIQLAAQTLDLPDRVEIKLHECPCCESQGAISIVFPVTGEPFTHCPRGCGVEAMTGALAERMIEQRGAGERPA